MGLKAIIVDDEDMGRQALRQKLQDYCPEVEIIGEAESGEFGLGLIERLRPEIVFLDIQMPRMDGFQMLQRLAARDFHLVFTTAYDQYAIKAIRYAAFDYLLKPVDIDELKSVVLRIRNQAPVHTARKLGMLEQNMVGKTVLDKIVIPTLTGILFFNISDIVHLEASRNYTTIYFHNQPVLLASKSLKEFADLLPSDVFFRPHHSHLINLRYIKRYIKGDGGKIEMQNGNFIEVSRKKKDYFLKIIGY